MRRNFPQLHGKLKAAGRTSISLMVLCSTLALLSIILSRFNHNSLELSRAQHVVAFTPTSGLGNNILALLSVFLLAKELDRDFAVDWGRTSTSSCQAGYEDIFFVTSEQTRAARKFKQCSQVCELELTQKGLKGCWQSILCSTKEDVKAVFRSCPCVRISSNQFFAGSLPRSTSDLLVPALDSHLKPSIELSRRIVEVRHSWMTRHHVNHIIGVHIRSAFYNSGRDDNNFIPKDGLFERVFWPCILKVRQKIADENVGVFVAADTELARRGASKLIGLQEGIIEVSSPLTEYPNDTGLGPVRDRETVLDAALELFLLGQSDSLFVFRDSKFRSTFSAAAAMIACREKSGSTCYYVADNKCEGANVVTADFHFRDNINCSAEGSNCVMMPTPDSKFKIAGGH